MPCSVRIKLLLDGARAKRQNRSPHPSLYISKHPLDLGVELPCTDLTSDVRNTKRLDALMEVSLELAAMIRNQKPRRRLTALDRCLNQFRQIIRCRPPPKHLHRDDFPAETIDDSCDLNLLPEYTDLGHVHVPDLLRFCWMTHMARGCRHTWLIALLQWIWRAFLKHSPDRASADSDARSYDVSSNRPRPKLRLWERLTNLMHEPAYTVMQPVPRRAAQKPLGSQLVVDGLLPIPDRVGMHHESHPRLLGRPAPQFRDFKDLGAFGWRVVRPLMGWLPQALSAEYRQLSLKQRGIVVDPIALPHQLDQRRDVLEHPGPSCDRGTHEQRRDAIRHRPHRSIRLAQFNTPRAMSGTARADIRKLLIQQYFRWIGPRYDRTFRTSLRGAQTPGPPQRGQIGGHQGMNG